MLAGNDKCDAVADGQRARSSCSEFARKRERIEDQVRQERPSRGRVVLSWQLVQCVISHGAQ
jgi:hypothetical protein